MKTAPIVQDRTGDEGNAPAELARPPGVQAALGELVAPRRTGCSR